MILLAEIALTIIAAFLVIFVGAWLADTYYDRIRAHRHTRMSTSSYAHVAARAENVNSMLVCLEGDILTTIYDPQTTHEGVAR